MINNPVAVKFSNERVRPAADTIARAYSAAKGILAMWSAQKMGTRITDTTDVIIDGAKQDGRLSISGADANRIIEALSTIVTALDGVASDGNTHITNALRVAVNPVAHINVNI